MVVVSSPSTRRFEQTIANYVDVTVTSLSTADFFFAQLKVPHQFDFFARLISNSVCENSKLPSIHYDMLARLCNFCI